MFLHESRVRRLGRQLRLLESGFVLVQLAVDSAQLKPKHGLEPKLVELVRGRHVLDLKAAQVVEARFEAQRALLQLAELLVAETHIVKQGQGVRFVVGAAAVRQVNHVQHAVCLLQQRERLFKLLSVDQLDRRLAKLNQDERDFFFGYLQFAVVVLAKLVLQWVLSFVLFSGGVDCLPKESASALHFCVVRFRSFGLLHLNI